MVFSYYLRKYPYSLIYGLLKLLRAPRETVFYCRELQDWDAFEPVQKHLKPITVVTNKAHVRKHLKNLNIKTKGMLCFPKAVIMARHSCYKFPSDDIIKIGMRHGPYHFKKMTRAENYNQFDRYLMTSKDDVAEGVKTGISCAVAVGYPKLDPALNHDYGSEYLKQLRGFAGMKADRPTLLFSATWLGSGMSALLYWYDRLNLLTDKFNVLVTLHPWIGEEYRAKVKQRGAYLIETNHIPFIYLADLVIGDTSSLLAEACALDKPIITWQTGTARRSLEKIDKILRDISLRISNWDELEPAIERLLHEPELLRKARAEAIQLMFDELDGRAGERAASEIIKLLPELRP